MNSEFRDGDIVWTNLGISYGWWPAEFRRQGPDFRNDKENRERNSAKSEEIFVRFFDDEKYDLYRVNSADLIIKYSGDPDKLKRIREGFDKFEKGSETSLFDARARQAQFYKDVEMAEVLTDNSPQVAELLSRYEVIQDDEGEGKDKKSNKGSKKKSTKR